MISSSQFFLEHFNVINSMYYVYIFLIIGIGVPINCKWLSDSVVANFYKYGKLCNKKYIKKLPGFMLLPKRWFLHFYITTAFMIILSWILIWYSYVGGHSAPEFVKDIFSMLTYPERKPVVRKLIGVIALILYSLHLIKRFLETALISVFSSSKINILHYIMAHTHYVAAFCGLLSFFPGFSSLTLGEERKSLNETSILTSWEYFSIILTLLASALQFHSLKILADLRRKSKGSAEKHFIPYGGLFSIVSCPHMLCEILVYVGIASLMSFQHPIWNSVLIFVVSNQIVMGMITHKWYKETFKDYPLERKAIFPFLL